MKRSLAAAFAAVAGFASVAAPGLAGAQSPAPEKSRQVSAWHLKNPVPRSRISKEFIDMNVAPLRGSLTGKGCKAAAVEAMEPDDKGLHADLVRSLINNQSKRVRGQVGVAPAAEVTIHRQKDDTLRREDLAGYHVLNHSHQLSIPYSPNNGTSMLHEYLAQNARSGLGAIIFSSAGNNDVPFYEREKLRPEVMTIGALGANGHVAKFSAKGAYVFALAPGDGIVFNPHTIQNGTSFAAPLAAGTGCLMLEANPALGYRDAQDIIALTARSGAVGGAAFRKNAASILNGGGYAYRNGAGFGLIDAYAAVRLAETWDRLSAAGNVKTIAVSAPNNGINHVKRSENVAVQAADNLVVEHVQIHFGPLKFRSAPPKFTEGNVRLVLTSPSGTPVEIFRASRDWRNVTGEHHDIRHSAATPYFRGEPAKGTWTLSLKSPEGRSVTLDNWSLVIKGREETNRTYFYTNDYKPYGTARTLSARPDAGSATINTAAIPHDAILYLSGKSDSFLGDKPLRIAPNAVKNAVTGDGHDRIFGHPLGSSRFFAGRGDDILIPYGQGNSFVYRAGIDGNDVITPAPGARGTLLLRNVANAAEIIQTRTGNDIVLQFAGKSGSVTLRNAAIHPVIDKIVLEAPAAPLNAAAPVAASLSPRPQCRR